MDQKRILSGVVGSHAYNLATQDSDIDRMQVCVEPIHKTLGLSKEDKSHHQQLNDGDLVSHEMGKFCKLALEANPNVLEFLFLPGYEFVTDEGRMLLDRRYHFLSNKIRQTFGGYAYGQFKKLKQRDGDSFSSDTRLRTQKHARHMFRLLFQGKHTLETGEMQVGLSNEQADSIKLFANLGYNQMIEAFEHHYKEFQKTSSVLPDEPNWQYIDDLVVTLRFMQAS